MNAANPFLWYYYNTSIQAHTLDKTFRVQVHYKHAAILKVFTVACCYLAWNEVSTNNLCQEDRTKDRLWP